MPKSVAMRKHLLLLLFAVLSLAANSQTNVSGGIYANTTWTKVNSPYIADTIVVFPGVTLTIEPGVVVIVGGGMEIRQASLIAEGTATDSITFIRDSVIDHDYRTLWFNKARTSKINYCNIKDAVLDVNHYGIYVELLSVLDTLSMVNSTCALNGVGLFCKGTGTIVVDSCLFENNALAIRQTPDTIKNSIFRNNQDGLKTAGGYIHNCLFNFNLGVAIDWGGGLLANCQITNNGIGIYCQTNGYPSQIHNNIIEDDSIGIQLLNVFGQDSIYCNRICNNRAYNIQNKHTSAGYVANNYWCTTDSIIIAGSIYDGYDNANVGLVYFMPIDTGQCYFTGCNISISTVATNATCDTCHNGTASAYLLYAANPVVYTWNSSPLQTTQTATGLAPGNYTICVVDANSCTACHTVFIDSSNCSGFSVAAQATNATCSTCSDGTAQVNVTGGAPPYSYTWYTSPLQNTATAVGLPQGTYSVCVNDLYGCAVCDSATVSIGNCSAHFNLYPDSVPHNYTAVNMASGNGPLTYLWSWGDGATDTGPYPSHTYASAGFYSICLSITDSVGCTNTYCNNFYLQRNTNAMVSVNVVAGIGTGISAVTPQSDFRIYPNPASDAVTISVDESMIGALVSISDMTGREMLKSSFAIRNPQFDIRNFESGVYFVSVTNKEGRSAAKKLVISK